MEFRRIKDNKLKLGSLAYQFKAAMISAQKRVYRFSAKARAKGESRGASFDARPSALATEFVDAQVVLKGSDILNSHEEK